VLPLLLIVPQSGAAGGATQREAASNEAGRPVLAFPVDCRLGGDCFVQSLVDVDPGPAARDYRCGGQTYDGHKGTDIRLLSTEASRQGVRVFAAAPGRIAGMRDGMSDELIGRDDAGQLLRRSIRGRECGNGVVIDHGNGWQSQYCHMKAGTVRVRSGQLVRAGDTLGEIGYSGLTEFAHLHITVRHRGRVIDPFTGQAVGSGSCQRTDGDVGVRDSMWEASVRRRLRYTSNTLIDVDFSAEPVDARRLEAGQRYETPSARSPALVLYARAINLEKGTRFDFDIEGPGGFSADGSGTPVDRAKAHWVAFFGKRLTSERWPAGRYRGRVRVMNGERLITEQRRELVIQ